MMKSPNNKENKQINDLQRNLLEKKSVVNNLPFPAWIKDSKGKFTYVNKAFAACYGMTKEQMHGLTNHDIYQDRDLAKKYTDADNAVLREKKQTEEEIITDDGSIFKIYKSPVLDEQNKAIGITGISIDITEQRNLISNLSRERDLLQGLMNNIPDTIYFKDTKSRFTRINQAQANMIGVEKPEDAIGKTDFDFFNKEHAEVAYKDEQELMSTGKAVLSKLEKLINAKGETKWVTATKIPLKNSAGDIIGLVGISRDVTDSIKAEQKLKLAKQKAEESEKLKTAFLANISHQIRTPMNGIIGFLNLLEKNSVTEAERKDCIKYIRKSSKQLLNLINKIIIISEIESGQLEINYTKTYVNTFLKDLYDIFSICVDEDPSKDIELNLSLGNNNNDFYILSDPHRLKDIMDNLIENAIKFTDKGSVTFGYSLKNNEMVFFVKDTGVGIPVDKIKSIFERFDQSLDNQDKADHEGTGIGLTISKYLVSQLGGKINVQSKPQKGSEFWFNIPIKKTKDKNE